MNLKNVITTPGLISIKKSCTVNGTVMTGDSDTDLSGVAGTHPMTVASASVLDLNLPSAISTVLAQYNEVNVTSAQIAATSVAAPYVFDGSVSTAVYYTANMLALNRLYW